MFHVKQGHKECHLYCIGLYFYFNVIATHIILVDRPKVYLLVSPTSLSSTPLTLLYYPQESPEDIISTIKYIWAIWSMAPHSRSTVLCTHFPSPEATYN